MPIRQYQLEDILIIAPGQKLSATESGEDLSKAVQDALEKGTRRILFDFSEVEFIDSLGVGQIVASFVSTKNRGGHLILCGLRPRIALVLRMASLHLVLDIKDTGPGAAMWD